MQLPFQIANQEGLIALLALLPLIVLYLIRPRPRPMNIPSLMFFLKSSGSRRLTSFLKQITHDWLFLIQLLMLTALALTFSHPFTTYEHDVTASNTVIVLDVSASSQVAEGTKTRFDASISQARKVLGTKNTIILAKDVPYVALQDATSDEAQKYLSSLRPKETASKIGEAIILAGEALGSEGRVVVISDFINTGGQDPHIAKAVLESKGLIVDFINVLESPRRNIGIVQMDAGNDQTTIYVKNFNSREETAVIKIANQEETLKIPSKAIETYTFKTPPGVTKIDLFANDEFAIDNVAYLSAPKGGKSSILLVANNASQFLRNALLASGDFDVILTEPPVIPDGEFDVIILNNLDMRQVLPGTFEEIKKQAEKGASVIVTVQQNSQNIDYKGLLSVKLDGTADGGFVNVEQLNRFTKNIDFGKTNSYHKAEPLGEQTIIATIDKNPVMTIKNEGLGKTVYYGMPDDSDFVYSPHYPIFWTELIKYVTEQQDVRNLNLKTGDTLILDSEQKIKTPTKVVKRAALLLDEQGVYELEDRIVSANLVNEQESEINAAKEIGTKSTDYELRPIKETRKFMLDIWLIVFALGFITFEVFFIKYRGDL